ncbi:M4 family metallopeptidase [Nocardioides sp. WS12]|uniref:M4 family metallopeptidase n=1 Tax=Nocardioides sp. WS12 TaxID=2486272 RepID=UPI0015FD1F55|nr:M4 family metallopeptidase [Nocardioides sp. WS12]
MRRALSSLCAATVVATLLALAPAQPAQSAPDPDDAEAALRSDADGSVVVRKDGDVVTFAGASAGTDVDNPSVDRGDSVSAAARAHLQRYGPAFGTARPGTTLIEARRDLAVAGAGVVHYQQHVGGIPVIGGDAVVVLADDKDLSSVNANLSEVQAVPAATIAEPDARRTAIAKVRRSAGGSPTAAAGERWLWDPAALGRTDATGPRGVWRFEVRGDGAVRHQVLVDDRAGAVLLDLDLVQDIDRVVCDQENASLVDPPACTAGFDRTEASSPSAVGDVEQAFHNAGATAELYEAIVDVDLTDFIGLDTASGRKLASTVRVCVTGDPCPYSNAYWDGRQMFYGAGYAAADDVVGHEMTHGVIERTSGLLYLDQPGAINESIADIIGEIVDHRNMADGESVTWTTGEDLPGGALRDMANPTASDQPDRMTSTEWDSDPTYWDNGGVHTNSGVGNKAFHLISQGGEFNGQTITGIDAGDPTLDRSARLWIQVLGSLTAFTEYTDLADVLEQSCAALVGSFGFTTADCAAVQQAVTATEMRLDPLSDPMQDADRTCPTGTHATTLFDSERGATATQAGMFQADAGWGRTPGTEVNEEWGVHAYSGDTAWVAEDPGSNPTNLPRSLTATNEIPLPYDQPSYLAFRQWHVTDFDVTPTNVVRYWDGGTVEAIIGDNWAKALASEPWVNGPTRTLQTPNHGVKAFAGSSRGWVGSRVDLSSIAGQRIKPRFTMRSDDSLGAPGWYIDDVVVYTCFASIYMNMPPEIVDTYPIVGGRLTATPGQWDVPDAVVSYQWLRNGVPISGATSRIYTLTAADRGRYMSVRRTLTALPLVASEIAKLHYEVDFGQIRPPRAVGIAGTARVGRVLTARPGTWSPSPVTLRYQWLRDNRWIPRATSSRYKLRRIDRGHRISVIVTGSRPGYMIEVKRSPKTARVRR